MGAATVPEPDSVPSAGGLSDAELYAAYALPERGTPRVRLNFVSSLDGAATLRGRSGGLGNADDQRVMEVLRTVGDVVLVGAGTVRAEGYGGMRVSEAGVRWRRRNNLPDQPPLAIVSRSLDLDPAHPVFSDAVQRPLLLSCAAAPAGRRQALAAVAEVVDCGESDVDPDRLVAELAGRGLAQILCEGGPHLFGALIAADRVDELCLSLSPLLVAGDAGRIARGAPETERRMRLVHALPAGDLLLLRYAAATSRA